MKETERKRPLTNQVSACPPRVFPICQRKEKRSDCKPIGSGSIGGADPGVPPKGAGSDNSPLSLGRLWPFPDRPSRVSILGRNTTNVVTTNPGRDSVTAFFSDCPVHVYHPRICSFSYLPLYLYFCAYPLPSLDKKCPVGPISGIIEYRWLLFQDAKSFQSVVKLRDVDAPMFFIDNAPPESCYLERPHDPPPDSCSTGQLRPLDVNPTPHWYVCDQDEQGTLFRIDFNLSILHHSCTFLFKWQLQVGESISTWTDADTKSAMENRYLFRP